MAAAGYTLADGGERTRVDVGGKKLRPCGTYAAFQRHQKRDEEPCEACVAAASTRTICLTNRNLRQFDTVSVAVVSIRDKHGPIP